MTIWFCWTKRHRWAALLPLLLATAALGQAEIPAAKPIYQLSVAAQFCRMRLEFNGMEWHNGPAADVISWPLNPYLFESDNALSITTFNHRGPCVANVTLTRFDGGAGARATLFAEQLHAEQRTTEHRFDSSIDLFARYRDAEPLTDMLALKRFAVVLAETVDAGQFTVFREFMAPKTADYQAAFGASRATLDQSLRELIEAFTGEIKPVTIEDVRIEPLLGGRLARLRRVGHPSALLIVDELSGSQLTFEVIVARVDGQIRVVR